MTVEDEFFDWDKGVQFLIGATWHHISLMFLCHIFGSDGGAWSFFY